MRIENELSIDGHAVTLSQVLISRKERQAFLTQPEIDKIPSSYLLSVSDAIAPDPAGIERRFTKFEIPVYKTVGVTFDIYDLKIFHTSRGPILGAVSKETENTVILESACLLDPNSVPGKIRYFPIAFATSSFKLYKNFCLGESIPEPTVAAGYPKFYDANQAGDFQYVSSGAYHAIDADMFNGTRIPAVELVEGWREDNAGITPTSNIAEIKQIDKHLQRQAAEETPAEPVKESANENTKVDITEDPVTISKRVEEKIEEVLTPENPTETSPSDTSSCTESMTIPENESSNASSDFDDAQFPN